MNRELIKTDNLTPEELFQKFVGTSMFLGIKIILAIQEKATNGTVNKDTAIDIEWAKFTLFRLVGSKEMSDEKFAKFMKLNEEFAERLPGIISGMKKYEFESPKSYE